MTVSVLDLAIFRGATAGPDGAYNGEELARVGLDILGGCELCGASISADNGYPTISGYWWCRDCVRTYPPAAWEDVAEADRAIFGPDEGPADSEESAEDVDDRFRGLVASGLAAMGIGQAIARRVAGYLPGPLAAAVAGELVGVVEDMLAWKRASERNGET